MARLIQKYFDSNDTTPHVAFFDRIGNPRVWGEENLYFDDDLMTHL
jgi:hypothetical protein